MVGIIISCLFIVLAIVIFLYNFLSGTKYDRIVKKQKKTELKNADKSEKSSEKMENSELKPVKDNKQKNDSKQIINQEKNDAQNDLQDKESKIDIDKLKQEIVEDTMKQISPIIDEKISNNKQKKNSNNIGEEIKNLSPKMKAIVFTDVLKPKY